MFDKTIGLLKATFSKLSVTGHHQKFKTLFCEYFLILSGSVLYGLSTVVFIFPCDLLLGGTSGISVILENFISVSPGTVLMIINFALIILAFAVLGKNMAIKTLVGSVLTTVLIGAFEKILVVRQPVIPIYISAIIGSAVIAVASGVIFYVGSSSGGTDVIALIIRKFSGMNIGKALLVTDILIVLAGGFLLGFTVLIYSFIGLCIKTMGIDLVILIIKKLKNKSGENDAC